jgi:hypothetical protein
MESGLFSAIIKTGPMLLISVAIQGTFAKELISQHIYTVGPRLEQV